MKLLSELKRFFIEIFCSKRDFEKERKEQFSEVIYITEYWNEKQAVFDDWNLTLLLERREARKEEGEALVPYIFSAETMGIPLLLSQKGRRTVGSCGLL